MKATERDALFAALSRLPPPTQHTATRAETLTLTLRALAAAPGSDIGGSRSGRSFVGLWLTRERFVPAVLCLAGALYTHGAVRQLMTIFARQPASLVRAAQKIESRARAAGANVVEPRPANAANGRRNAG